MIIDCHGHYTTAPRELDQYRANQLADLKNLDALSKAGLNISDAQIRESVEKFQLKIQRERGTDLTIFSPRASGMAHHAGNAAASADWARVCNDMIHRICAMFPRNFIRCMSVAAITWRVPIELHRRIDTMR